MHSLLKLGKSQITKFAKLKIANSRRLAFHGGNYGEIEALHIFFPSLTLSNRNST